MLIRLTHANPYPPRRSIGCRKRVVTQIHRPDRPGPPRSRHTLAVPSPQPKATSQGSPPSLDEPALGRPGRSGALHGACRRFRFALQTPIYTRCAPVASPRSSHATPAGQPALVAQTSRLRPRPPRAPGRQTRVRCACRVAPWRWGSNSAPPPSMGHAPIPPDSSISKSTPRDLDFECPAVAFKIERAKCQVGAPNQSSMTKRSFRHGFEFCTGWCRTSCSTWKFKQFDFFSTV